MVKKNPGDTIEKNASKEKGLADAKFIILLSSFSKDEVGEFIKFLESPYCNRKGLYLVKAFNEIKKFHPVYNSAQFTRENIFNALYPKKEYNDVLMRKILSELQKLGEEFLASIKTKDFDFHYEMKLLSSYRERKLDKFFEKKYAELSEYLNDPTGKLDENFFRNRNIVEAEAMKYELYKNRQHKTVEIQLKMNHNTIYDALINILDALYGTNVLKEVNYTGGKDFISEAAEFIDFNKFGKFLKKNAPDDFTIFEILFYRCIAYLENENDEYYEKAKTLLYDHLHYFGREEQYIMLIALQNNAIKKIRYGDKREHYIKELFGIFKFMLEKELLISPLEKFMRISTYRNVFLSGFMAGDYKWCEWFLEKYKASLSPDVNESAYYLLHSEIEFVNKNYDKALNDLQKVKYDHFMMKKEVQINMLKIYYETSAYEPALSLIDNLKHYYKDTKTVSQDFRNTDVPFLKFLQQIILYRSGNKKTEKEELAKEIERVTVIEKKWLLEKVDQLENLWKN